MTLHIDDSFLDDLGLPSGSEDQKQALMAQILETLELRVGTRLASELSDGQLDELESLTPIGSDNAEVAERKNAHIADWLKANHPGYEDIIAEELEGLKKELSVSLKGIFDTTSV